MSFWCYIYAIIQFGLKWGTYGLSGFMIDRLLRPKVIIGELSREPD